MDNFTLILKKPFEYEGQTYTEITLDWTKLTGKDAMALEDEMQSEGIRLVANEAVDGKYQLKTAAKASGIAENVLRALPIREVQALKNAARQYLYSGDGSTAARLDFDGFTGQDAEIIEDELRAARHTVDYTPTFDTLYAVKMAARALDVPEDQITGLPMAEFLNVKMKVRYFFLELD